MIRRLVLALALASATLTGTLGSPAAATVPTVGSCHQLTPAQGNAASDALPAVPCTGRHDTQTVGVVQSPTPLAGLDNAHFTVIGEELCNASWMKAFGRPSVIRDQTVYSGLFFRPTDAELAAGENWVRCDVVMQAGRQMLPLPRHLLTAPIVPRQITLQVRRCLVGPQKLTTPCSRPHSYRSVSAFTVPQSSPLPDSALLAAAQRHCPPAWRWASWTLAPIRQLDKTVVCYIKTTH